MVSFFALHSPFILPPIYISILYSSILLNSLEQTLTLTLTKIVKFLAVDDQLAILGNGNQDTQSYFHSQEINLMIDSSTLVAEWINGINANQNTLLYGRVDSKDGVWRDKEGNELVASGVSGGGPLGRLKGLSGAVKRVRGTGGF